ncbi:hypothetical protein LTR10_004566 [Elasticomyces elasticus]|nr:hypothetical protein LTR10_004566 [Elasticomyces elasticus]
MRRYPITKENISTPWRYASPQAMLQSPSNSIPIATTAALQREDDGTSGLLSLPAELLELIALQLPPSSDLLAFRLTCRDVESKTRWAFVDANFRRKTFLLCDQKSMQALLGISRHPIYSKTLKIVILAAWRVRDSYNDCRRKSRRDKQSATVARYATARESRIAKREGRGVHARVLAQHKQYWRRGQWQTHLFEALSTFAAARQTLESVAFAWGGHTPKDAPSPCGVKRLRMLLGHEDCLTSVKDSVYNQQNVQGQKTLNKVLASGCLIESLDMRAGNFADNILYCNPRFTAIGCFAGLNLNKGVNGWVTDSGRLAVTQVNQWCQPR